MYGVLLRGRNLQQMALKTSYFEGWLGYEDRTVNSR